MDADNRIKTFQAMAEVSRKWVTVLDAKAGFLVAINGALLAFIWTSAKLPASEIHIVRSLAFIGTGLALISLLLAVTVVFPRIKLDSKPSVAAVSFFAYVAIKFAEQDGSHFADTVLAMSDDDLAREALEQHHAISHIALIKSVAVAHAAGIWMGAFVTTAAAVVATLIG